MLLYLIRLRNIVICFDTESAIAQHDIDYLERVMSSLCIVQFIVTVQNLQGVTRN